MYLQKTVLASIIISIPTLAMQETVNLLKTSSQNAEKASNAEEWQLFYESEAFSQARALVQKGNIREALILIKSSATVLESFSDQGNHLAQLYLALLLHLIEGQVSAAKKLCEQSAEQGNIKAQTYLGILYKKEGNLPKAKRCFTLAAEKGCLVSQYSLGKVLEDEGLLDEAKKFFLLSAHQNYCPAQNKVGELLEKEAKKFYKLAADQGHFPARIKLGRILVEEGKIEEAERLCNFDTISGSSDEQELALNFSAYILLQKSARSL